MALGYSTQYRKHVHVLISGNRLGCTKRGLFPANNSFLSFDTPPQIRSLLHVLATYNLQIRGMYIYLGNIYTLNLVTASLHHLVKTHSM